ncbi:IS200/IS605 family transposase [Aetokthonos hydrillicola Thurmond2011]|jgi:putative transposase|uniref:IS200/IS605 family transposase n=1 Tax=Aetokthonos hydrillicola Thurmond2011 TaxID=2712845 RepID=A0AAP5MAW8_9CYAN|nr:IS200/IS605 family transposase [Aetokthonos hydrillicola]MBO3458192.1 IS200/IS605 family transposase [Aetokthonos hydrillicola CCALA 1050]MBW4584412.1 IS200/IS605 family transposase [Aetokthonos hydrillicola CCALA 1050]MDR9896373.1 IS200/IS605 family transposase [Aetokthonos hydrillicola Thurmond2011]
MSKLSPAYYEYRRAEGSVTSLNYHFVFCPKRRKAVLVNQVAARLQEIIFELVTEHGWKLIALEIMPDHVHCFLNVPPHESPSDIARWIKGRASHHLRQEFPELKKMPCLWSPSYFVASTGQVSTEVVKRYIEDQRSK